MKGRILFSPLKRVRYSTGQVLGLGDFVSEQEYFIEKHRRHNRMLHGCGVVSGLEVSIQRDHLLVDPGFALDCEGNEIAAGEPVEVPLPQEETPFYVAVSYVERETDPVPIPGNVGEEETLQNSRVEEGVEVGLMAGDPWESHPRGRRGTSSCGTSHPIPLAKLNFTRGRWRIDQRFRSPRVRG